MLRIHLCPYNRRIDYTPYDPLGERRQSWFRRHWGCAIALGLGLFGLLIAGAILGVGALIFGAIRNSDATRMAVAKAQANPAIVQRLGTPLTPGWFISGSIQTNNASGHAELSIPVSGPRGKGTVYAVADKQVGRWEFKQLEFAFDDTSPRLDLLQSKPTTLPFTRD